MRWVSVDLLSYRIKHPLQGCGHACAFRGTGLDFYFISISVIYYITFDYILYIHLIFFIGQAGRQLSIIAALIGVNRVAGLRQLLVHTETPSSPPAAQQTSSCSTPL